MQGGFCQKAAVCLVRELGVLVDFLQDKARQGNIDAFRSRVKTAHINMGKGPVRPGIRFLRDQCLDCRGFDLNFLTQFQ